MARQTINIGTSPNKGNGDPLRTAFTKINNNFSELYAGNFLSPTALNSSLIANTDGTLSLGSASNQWQNLHVKDFIYLGGTRLSVSASGTLLVNNNSITADAIKGSVFADDSTLLVDAVGGKHFGPLIGDVTGSVFADDSTVMVDANNKIFIGTFTGSLSGNVVGDVTGSVFADDSTLLVDGVNGNIPGYVKLSVLKTEVAASADFAAFKTRIAAL